MKISPASSELRYQSSLLALCVFIAYCIPGITSAASPVTERLRDEIAAGRTSIPVIVRFREFPELKASHSQAVSPRKLIEGLKSTLNRNLVKARALISNAEPNASLLPLWIDNSVATSLAPTTIKQLESLPGVESIDLDACDARMAESPAAMPLGISGSDTISVAWNLKKVGVDSVWLQYGLDGTGVLIGHMDSGIDTTHPALRGHMRAGSASWFDPVNFRAAPYDDMGHGTGTIGVVIGGDGPGAFDHDIGIAYNAKFIATKMLAYAGNNPNSIVINAAQWLLDPDQNPATKDFPAVISNSWYSGTRGSTWFLRAAQAWYNAGIIPVFCAGNEGPATESTTSPGDYTVCLSIGGTNSIDRQYSATSIGPSAEGPDFPFDLAKPDFSAPGESVLSSVKGAGYANMSGTSFSAPHAAGIIALMLQAAPGLTFDQVKDILTRSSADLGTQGYDYTFGNGRLDALKAVRYALGKRVIVTGDSLLQLNTVGEFTDLSFRLTAQPLNPVTVSFTQSAPNRLSFNPASITFTKDNWNTTQTLRATYSTASANDVTVSVGATFSSSDKLWNRMLIPSQPITLKASGATGVYDQTAQPREFTLEQNYPNPFNPATTIAFALPEQAEVTLKVYDSIGQEISTLLSSTTMTAGNHGVTFNAARSGISLPSGVYWYTLQAHSASGSRMLTRRMTLIR